MINQHMKMVTFFGGRMCNKPPRDPRLTGPHVNLGNGVGDSKSSIEVTFSNAQTTLLGMVYGNEKFPHTDLFISRLKSEI